MPHSELAGLELLAEVDALAGRLSRWAEGPPSWQPAEPVRALVRTAGGSAASLRIRLEAPFGRGHPGRHRHRQKALVDASSWGRRWRRPAARANRHPAHARLSFQAHAGDAGHRSRRRGTGPTRSPGGYRQIGTIDCPDPDTTEEDALQPAPSPAPRPGKQLGQSAGDFAPLRRAAGHGEGAEYRSARVADQLAAAAPGEHLVFVQTHADVDEDIRDDWRHVLEEEKLPVVVGRRGGDARAEEEAASPTRPSP